MTSGNNTENEEETDVVQESVVADNAEGTESPVANDNQQADTVVAADEADKAVSGVAETEPAANTAPAADNSNDEKNDDNKEGKLVLTKTITGDVAAEQAAGTVSFQIKDENGNYLKKNGSLSSSSASLTLADFSNTGNGTYSLNITTDELGKYTVTEKDSSIDGVDVTVSHSVNGGSMQTGSSATALVKENSTTKVAFAAEYELMDAAGPEVKAAEALGVDEYTAVPIEVPYEKIWDDNDNADGTRPSTLKVTLYCLIDGTKHLVDELTLSAENEWKGVFEVVDTEDSPVFYKDDTGCHAYPLTVEEEEIPGYTESDRKEPSVKMDVYTGDDYWDWITPNSTKTYPIYTDGAERSFIAAKKGNQLYIWTKEKLSLLEQQMIIDVVESHPQFPKEDVYHATFYFGDGHCDEGEFTINSGNPGSIVFDDHSSWSFWARGTYSRSEPSENAGWIKNEIETTSVSVSKVWEDADDQDGKRPDSITYNLLANGTKVQEKTVTETDNWACTFSDLPTVQSGTEITYTVTENAVTDYETEINGTAADGFTVTNTHEPEVITITGKKVWEDADDQDGKRPESITINLMKNGEKAESKTVTESDNWTWSFENVPKYEQGEEITYTITEDEVTDYETEITGSTADGFTVTNTHEPEVITITGEKVWEDADDQDGKRPVSITVNLMKNGEKAASKTVTESDNWAWSFEDVPKYEQGEEIEYTVEETAVTDYETEITGSAAEGFVITNTHTPEKVNIGIRKVWDDSDNADGKRPESLNVTLSTGDSYTLTEEENWELSIDGLDKYKDGKEIEYTWTEEEVSGYKLTKTETATSGEAVVTTFTNTIQPEEEPEPEPEPEDPDDKDPTDPSKGVKTGDNGYAEEMLIFIVSVTSLMVAVYERLRRRDQE